MATPTVLTVALLLIAVVAVALFLITVVTMLHIISNRLNKILGAVGLIVEKTDGVEPIIKEIADDLLAGQKTIEGSVSRLAIRKGVGDTPDQGSERDREPAGFGSSTTTAPSSGFSNY